VYSLGENFETVYTGENIFLDQKPTLMRSVRNIEQVAQRKYRMGSEYFFVMLNKNGELFAQGCNDGGRLSHPKERTNVYFPTLVSAVYGESK